MPSELQKRLEIQLNEKGLSITRLEDLAGVKRNIVRNIVNGQSKMPNAKNLQALAKALECSVEDLLGEGRSRPSNTLLLEDPKMFEHIVKQVLATYKTRREVPGFERFLSNVREIYLYATTREPQGVEEKFIEWLIDQKKS